VLRAYRGLRHAFVDADPRAARSRRSAPDLGLRRALLHAPADSTRRAMTEPLSRADRRRLHAARTRADRYGARSPRRSPPEKASVTVCGWSRRKPTRPCQRTGRRRCPPAPGGGPDRRQRPGRVGRPLRFRFVWQKQSSARESATLAWIVRTSRLALDSRDARKPAGGRSRGVMSSHEPCSLRAWRRRAP
jgi:hypothetical protein